MNLPALAIIVCTVVGVATLIAALLFDRPRP
jgi:hypothetical protein